MQIAVHGGAESGGDISVWQAQQRRDTGRFRDVFGMTLRLSLLKMAMLHLAMFDVLMCCMYIDAWRGGGDR